MMTPRHHPFTSRAGFTLAELLVTVGLVAVMLSVFGGVIATVGAFKRNDFRFQAANFVREEIDALHALPYSELVNQVDGHFLGLAFTRGAWRVQDSASAPSGTKVLELAEPASPALLQETGLLVLPTNYHDDFTLLAKLRAVPTSPSGWGMALAFRYRDASNHYRFRLTAGGYALDKVVHGTVTTLWSQSAAINTGSWYSLAVRGDGDTIHLWSNGLPLVAFSDASFGTGDLAVMALNGVVLRVDDLAVGEGGEVGSWNFDAETTGGLPTDLQRFVYFDLPDGRGTLTVEDYLGLVGIKQITVNVSWSYRGQPQAVSGTTLIADTD